jgi:hypothetical protein
MWFFPSWVNREGKVQTNQLTNKNIIVNNESAVKEK